MPPLLTAIDTEAVGVAAMILGAGRARKEDNVDPAVGIVLHKVLGERVAAGEPMATLHVNERSGLEAAKARFLGAYTFGEAPPVQNPLVTERIVSRGVDPNA